MILNNPYSSCLYLAYYSPSYVHNRGGSRGYQDCVRSIFLLRMLTAKRNIHWGHSDRARGHILMREENKRRLKAVENENENENERRRRVPIRVPRPEIGFCVAARITSFRPLACALDHWVDAELPPPFTVRQSENTAAQPSDKTGIVSIAMSANAPSPSPPALFGIDKKTKSTKATDSLCPTLPNVRAVACNCRGYLFTAQM